MSFRRRWIKPSEFGTFRVRNLALSCLASRLTSFYPRFDRTTQKVDERRTALV